MDLYEFNRICLLHIVTIKLVWHYFDSISTMNVGGAQTRSIVEQIERVTQINVSCVSPEHRYLFVCFVALVNSHIPYH
jgi:hypothetical protein